MTNNFYNININKYDPSQHINSGYGNDAQMQETSVINNVNIAEPNINTINENPSHTRLNALDSTILVNEAYQNLDDSDFKTEYHINKLESDIELIDKEIENAKVINDFQKCDILVMRKHALQEKLRELNANYCESDVTNKISGEITSIFNKKPKLLLKLINTCVNFMSSKVLPKVSSKFNSGVEIKTALNKLETLNKNVDELVTTQMPYGEADERYDMLSEYLNRANVIHFNISKSVGTPTFFDTISSIDKAKFDEVRKNSSNFGNMTARPNGLK